MSSKKTQRVSVLGEKWTIERDADLTNVDGIADKTTRIVQIAEMEPGTDTVKDLESYKRKVTRHELVHALLFESGLHQESGWSEQQIDWLAVQFPKMQRLFKEAGCLE
jgi:hypothetical protein